MTTTDPPEWIVQAYADIAGQRTSRTWRRPVPGDVVTVTGSVRYEVLEVQTRGPKGDVDRLVKLRSLSSGRMFVRHLCELVWPDAAPSQALVVPISARARRSVASNAPERPHPAQHVIPSRCGPEGAMRVRINIAPLPTGIASCIVSGDRETTIHVADGLTLQEACATIQACLGDWLAEEWLYIGDVTGHAQSDPG